MNITETQEMKARIDSVIEAASKYGKQAEILSETRTSLTEFIKQAEENNREFLAVAKMTKQVMDDTDKLVNGKLSEDLRPEIDRAIGVIAECKEHFSETTAKYEDALNKLEESKTVFADQHAKAEELLAQTTGEVQQSIHQVKEGLEGFETRFSALTDSISTTVASAFARIEAALPAVTEETGKLLAESEKKLTDNQTQSSDAILASLNNLSQSVRELSPLPEKVGELITLTSSQAEELRKTIGDTNAGVLSAVSAVSKNAEEIDRHISVFEADATAKLAQLQENVSLIQASIDQNRTLYLDKFQELHTEAQAIQSELSSVYTRLSSANTELEKKVDALIVQNESSAKQQRWITIGCSAVVFVTLLLQILLK